MTHRFLTFPKNWPQEADFRNAYAALTGENIESSPQENADGTLFMVGTARLDNAAAAQLLSHPDFGAALYVGDTPPPGWVPQQGA